MEEIQRIVEEVEEEIHRLHDKEVPSSVIGELVTERSRWLDQVAYVRFASVYRQFKTLEELVQEARAVIDAQRYDVPGQGDSSLSRWSRRPTQGPNPAGRRSPPRAEMNWLDVTTETPTCCVCDSVLPRDAVSGYIF